MNSMNFRKTEWPMHAAAPNTHNKVFEIMMNHLQNPDGLHVCDIPCGSGAFSRRLAAAGMNVTSVDIEAIKPFLFDEEKRILADANDGLPFNNGQFDAVVSIEGIEHFENPSFFLRECARVVKHGGWVFLSTPNVDSFRSRKYVFSYGYHKYFGPWPNGAKDSGHLHPIDMLFVKNATRQAGLSIVEIGVNELKGRSVFKELLRPMLTKKLPAYMRGPIPFYGEVIIYALTKA